jgi:hypothetical protein
MHRLRGRIGVEAADRLARQDGRADERGARGQQQQRLVQADPVDQEAGDEDPDRSRDPNIGRQPKR